MFQTPNFTEFELGLAHDGLGTRQTYEGQCVSLRVSPTLLTQSRGKLVLTISSCNFLPLLPEERKEMGFPFSMWRGSSVPYLRSQESLG